MTGTTREWQPSGIDYPFPAPLERFVFSAVEPIPPFETAGRTPVLALGSNAAPTQLRRKFVGLEGYIPVSRAVVFDHVVVYSAHLTRYGALPATLFEYPGGFTFVAITWLDEAQLARMHETEALGVNYDYVELSDIRLEHDGELPEADAANRIGTYVSRHGPLRHGGLPIRLAETASSGCPLPALTQPAALRFAHRRVAPGLPFATFLERIVSDDAFRTDCSRRLSRH